MSPFRILLEPRKTEVVSGNNRRYKTWKAPVETTAGGDKAISISAAVCYRHPLLASSRRFGLKRWTSCRVLRPAERCRHRRCQSDKNRPLRWGSIRCCRPTALEDVDASEWGRWRCFHHRFRRRRQPGFRLLRRRSSHRRRWRARYEPRPTCRSDRRRGRVPSRRWPRSGSNDRRSPAGSRRKAATSPSLPGTEAEPTAGRRSAPRWRWSARCVATTCDLSTGGRIGRWRRVRPRAAEHTTANQPPPTVSLCLTLQANNYTQLLYILQNCVNLSQGRCPAPDWKHPTGRPRKTCIQRVEEDHGCTIDSLWSSA